jgi:adenine-specific DNA methylase
VICAALWPDPGDDLCPEAFRSDARRLMADWAAKHLGRCSTDSFGRFSQIAKAPDSLADGATLRTALLDFIADFANWDNSTVPAYLETSRALTQSAHEALGGAPGTRPLVVDPFAGGGSIPLEALRVGADAFASDLNPIPVLLNKVVLEYIPKYGQRLADEVRKWGAWIKEQAEKELAEFYPKDPDGATPIAYLWARTIRCEGPGCGAEVPLIRSTTLAKKAPVAHVEVNADLSGAIRVQLRPGSELHSTASVRAGKATCPRCGYSTPEKRVKDQLSERRGGGHDALLFAVLSQDGSERRFRPPTEQDRDAVRSAGRRFDDTLRKDPQVFPNEGINPLRPYKNTVGVCIVTRMGVTRFLDLYSPRQATTLACFLTLLKGVAGQLPAQKSILSGVLLCLHLAADRLAMQNTSLCRWDSSRSTVKGLFSKQALQVVWDFAEANPIGTGTGNWDGAVEWVAKVIEANVGLRGDGVAQQAAADALPLSDDSVDIVFTDPPYFAAIPYADLSDVFYVWLKRGLRELYPDLFRSPLVDRANELIVTNSSRGPEDEVKDPGFFAAGMERALLRSREATRPHGLGCVVFADASTDAWEAILSALICAGWRLTASWPIDTEMQNRTRAHSSASLQSSVFMVCRPRETASGDVTDEIGNWREVLAELPRRIHDWMPRLAAEGVVGADAIFACLGPALEIFSRYARVERANGDLVTLREYLEQVWAAVSREALSMIFDDPETAGLDEDARLTAMWLWTIAAPEGGRAGTITPGVNSGEDTEDDEDETRPGAKAGPGFGLEFDAARKIAQGLGAKLEALTHVVEVKGDKARLLSVAERTKHLFGGGDPAPAARTAARKKAQRTLFEELEAAAGQQVLPAGGQGLPTGRQAWGEALTPKAGSTTLDRVHQAMILFGAGRGEAMKRFLVEEGAGRSPQFWKLAQALSALYPAGTDEKRWVDGVLARKKGLGF